MTRQITLTTEAASRFLSWLDDPHEDPLGLLLDHPGYRAVVRHSGTWGRAITARDVALAAFDLPSPMYGLSAVRENAAAIRGAIEYVESNRTAILSLVEECLAQLFSEDVAYPLGLHCVVGYDWGIGLDGNVAVNLNSRLYLEDLREVGFMMVHEATHVAYERIHGPMGPSGIKDPGGFRHLVYTLIHNEGLAVYSALSARSSADCLGNRDYRLLLDPAARDRIEGELRRILGELGSSYPGDTKAEEILDLLSSQRLSYVAGCSAFMRLEAEGGLELVRQAIQWTPEEFCHRAAANPREV